VTPGGSKSIEHIKPGDLIQTQADDDQGDDRPDARDHAGDAPRWWEGN
jgi:hypothetical protein